MFRLSFPGIALVLLLLLPLTAATETGQDRKYEQAHRAMVRLQLEARDISDKHVLDAFRTVKRHLFVPDTLRQWAYNDHPLPIGGDQTISQPYIVALMTQLLEVDSSDLVLEIGTGSGYQAAILGEIVHDVYSIEIIEWLGVRADTLLQSLGYDNVHVKIGDGYQGWPEHAPFDGIIVTCAPTEIPQPLIDQLAEGGRMVIPVGDYAQELVLVRKVKGKIKRKTVSAVSFVPMTGEAEKE